MTHLRQTLDTTIEHTLTKLAQMQEKDGSFSSTASIYEDMSASELRHTTFTTSLVLMALKDLQDEAKDIAEAGLDFLLKEQHLSGALNYWQSSSPRFGTVPDDMDATFCALTALCLHRPKHIDGTVLNQIVALLIQTETEEGGPYNTWITDVLNNPPWQDMDIVVQANISYFLSLIDIGMPKIDQFLYTTLQDDIFPSKYYADPIVALYFIARANYHSSSIYRHENMDTIKERVAYLHQSENYWGNIQKTAMALSALLHCDISDEQITLLEPAINHLIEDFNEQEISAYPIYVQAELENTTSYSGSPAFTLAVIIEALSLYRKHIKEKIPILQSDIEMQESIMHRFIEHFKDIPEMKDAVQIIAHNIVEKDQSKQITLLPYLFHNSLKEKTLDSEVLILLGVTNLAGWIAYRIFDDILDDEGQPELLPIGNKCLRDVTSTYMKLLPRTTHTIFETIMNNLDRANMWERNNTYMCQTLPVYGDYRVLAHKSLAHCLGPVTILSLLGYKENHIYIQKIISFFYHYIIARQLHDDAHDWQSDLEKGFTNSVAAQLLTVWREQNEHEFILQDETQTLQEIFWYEKIVDIADDIRSHIQQAKEALTHIDILEDTAYLESLLEPLERGVQKALADREVTMLFLEVYGK